MADPVIVFYKAKQGSCQYCVKIANIWDNPPNNGGISISEALKKVNPNVRFITVTATDNKGSFNENLIPSDLIRYGVRFPQIIYIPGDLWDKASSKLGPNNDVKLLDGVRVMNYKIVGETMQYDVKYNTLVPTDYERWFSECLNDKNDKDKDENNNNNNKDDKNLVVPLKSSLDSNKLIKVHQNKKKEYAISEYTNTCSFRLVSQPK
jgi:hypothetical protein